MTPEKVSDILNQERKTKMKLPNELEQRVLARLRELYAKAEAIYGRAFVFPSLDFKDMGRTAGRAYFLENKIRLSPTLLTDNVETFFSRTIPHEVAHLVSFKVFPHMSRYHGREWARVMKELGATDIKRTHSYDTSKVSRKRKVAQKIPAPYSVF